MRDWDSTEVAATSSTNADLLAAAREGADEGRVLWTAHQTAGRGRLDRTWEAPAGTSLALSVLVRPRRSLADWPWLPLLTGLAVRDAVAQLGVPASVKWPNDVLAGDRKLAGILVETAAGAAVVGIGLNTSMTEDQLPVSTATSLAIQGLTIDTEQVVAAVLEQFGRRYEAWNAGGALRADYVTACSTMGARVRVTQPGGEIEGLASDVDDSGRLVVDGVPVSAGDVVHVRAAGS